WLGKSYASQLALPRLSPSDSLAVVRSIVPEQRVGHDVEQRIVSQAEGVPFFLEELARAVAEQPEPGSDVIVPETIQDVLIARLDRLSPDDRDLLQTASVVGRDVNVAVLRAVSRAPEGEFGRQLARLEAAEFLYQASLVSNASEYTFKHALTYE